MYWLGMGKPPSVARLTLPRQATRRESLLRFLLPRKSPSRIQQFPILSQPGFCAKERVSARSRSSHATCDANYRKEWQTRHLISSCCRPLAFRPDGTWNTPLLGRQNLRFRFSQPAQNDADGLLIALLGFCRNLLFVVSHCKNRSIFSGCPSEASSNPTDSF